MSSYLDSDVGMVLDKPVSGFRVFLSGTLKSPINRKISLTVEPGVVDPEFFIPDPHSILETL